MSINIPAETPASESMEPIPLRSSNACTGDAGRDKESRPRGTCQNGYRSNRRRQEEPPVQP